MVVAIADLDLAFLSSNEGYRIDAPVAGMEIGRVVKAGDIDNDGRAEIIIGSYLHDYGGRIEAGCVYVIWGIPGGI